MATPTLSCCWWVYRALGVWHHLQVDSKATSLPVAFPLPLTLALVGRALDSPVVRAMLSLVASLVAKVSEASLVVRAMEARALIRALVDSLAVRELDPSTTLDRHWQTRVWLTKLPLWDPRLSGTTTSHTMTRKTPSCLQLLGQCLGRVWPSKGVPRVPPAGVTTSPRSNR